MRKVLFLGVSVLVLAAASVGWSAAGGGGGGPRQDRLAGGGTFGPGCSDGTAPFCPANAREFSIDAAANPEGDGAYGTFVYGVPALGSTLVIGRITCLHVEGDSAVAGGYVTGGTAAATAQVFFVYMRDRGDAGSFTRDRSSAAFVDVATSADVPAGFPNECPPLDNNAFKSGYLDLAAGDVQITDAK